MLNSKKKRSGTEGSRTLFLFEKQPDLFQRFKRKTLLS